MTRHLPPQPSLSAADILEAGAEISAQIVAAADLESLSRAVTDRVRPLLQTDRVLVYRFLPDHDAVIAAESLATGCTALQGQMIYDPCFEGDWGDRYRQGHIGVIEDVQDSRAEACYLDLLKRFQVQANLVIPIFCGADLWALLIAHHCRSPRSWSRLDIQLMQHMAGQLGQAAAQAELRQLQGDLKTAKDRLFHRIGQETLLRNITAHMRETLDFKTILSATAAGVRAVFNTDRTVIYQFLADDTRRVAQQATRPPYPIVFDALLPPNPLPSTYVEHFQNGQTYIINDVAAQVWAPAMKDFLTTLQVKSVMLAPIVQNFGAPGPAVWGLLVVHSCAALRQWQPIEAEMLQHIADQLAIAMHQSALYQQLGAANQELDRLSKTDGLTRLANRRWLDEYLHQEWQRLARQQMPLSVILADVDYFKPYNDTYGHGAGDECLIDIAQAIEQAVRRPADLAARYGGEEFALVLPDTQEQGAIRVVELVRHHLQALALPHESSPGEKVITLSFGIATLIPQPSRPFDDILKCADQALYQAKEQGRNGYQVYRPEKAEG